MNEKNSTATSNEGSKRGRPTVATPEAVAQAAHELKSQSARVSVRAIMRMVGGSPKTVSEALKQLPDAKPSLNTLPPVPEKLGKLWMETIAEYIKSVLDECQEKLEAASQVIRSKEGDIYDLEARVIELEASVAAISTERDLARGERDTERHAHQQAQLASGANLARAEKAEAASNQDRARLDEMVQLAQAAELRAESAGRDLVEARKQETRAREENVRLKAQLDASTLDGEPLRRWAQNPAGNQPALSDVSDHERSPRPSLDSDSVFDDDIPF